MGTKGTPKSSIAIAVIFALSVFGLGLFVWVSFGGSVPLGARGYRVAVQLGPEATNIFPNAQVRVAGVDIGNVSSVKSNQGRVDVIMEIDPKYAPLKEGTRAILRSKTLLGEGFIELAPGPKGGRSIPENGRLAQNDIEEAQTVDNALSVFDADGRRDFRRFLEGVAKATDKRSPDLNAALGNAPLATADLRKLVDVLDEQRPAIQGLISDTATTLDTVGARGAAVQELARAGSEVLDTTATRQQALTETVRSLPRLMQSLRTFSAATVRLSNTAAPAVRTLRPIAPLLGPGLKAARQLAPELSGTLTALNGTISASVKGLPATTSVVRRAAPVLQALDPAGRELVPILQTLEAYRTDAVASMSNTAAATQATVTRADGSKKHYLRTALLFNDELAFGTNTRSGTHRENAYLAPGGLAPLLDGKPVASTSCVGTDSTPCLQQKPFSIAGGPAGIVPRVPASTTKP